MDPTGNGKVSFYLFSGYGTHVNDYMPTGDRSLEKNIMQEMVTLRKQMKVVTDLLESDRPLQVKSGDVVNNLIISAHGLDMERIALANTESDQGFSVSGDTFAHLLHDNLLVRNPKSIETIKTISLEVCGAWLS